MSRPLLAWHLRKKRSTIDALNALAIRRLWAGRLDMERLQAAAEAQEVSLALNSLESFVETLEGGTPEPEELERWVRPGSPRRSSPTGWK